jgi:hypothetical protein
MSYPGQHYPPNQQNYYPAPRAAGYGPPGGSPANMDTRPRYNNYQSPSGPSSPQSPQSPQSPYGQSGYHQGGYHQGGHHQGGHNQGGYNQGGYNQGGYNQGGHGQVSYRPGPPPPPQHSQMFNSQVGNQYTFQYSQCTGKRKVSHFYQR